MSLAAAAVAMLAASGWPASVYRDRDFIQYWLAGRALIAQRDLYDPAVWRVLHAEAGSSGSEIVAGSGFVYPLPTAMVAIPDALLPLAIAAPAWLVAELAAAIAALSLLARHASTTLRVWPGPALLALAALAQPAVGITIFGGNAVGFTLAIVAGALALISRGHVVPAGALLGLAVIKPQALLLFVPVLLAAMPFSRARGLAAGAAASGGGLVLVGLWLRPDWIAAWVVSAGRLPGATPQANLWGWATGDWRPIGWLVAAALLVGFISWWRARRPAFIPLMGAALALSLFVAPYAWSYDQVLLLVPLLVLVGWTLRTGARGRIIGFGLLTLFTAVSWWLHLASFARGNEVLIGLMPLVVFLAVIVTSFVVADAPTRGATARAEA
jgi:glycosyl transferase family 87